MKPQPLLGLVRSCSLKALNRCSLRAAVCKTSRPSFAWPSRRLCGWTVTSHSARETFGRAVKAYGVRFNVLPKPRERQREPGLPVSTDAALSLPAYGVTSAHPGEGWRRERAPENDEQRLLFTATSLARAGGLYPNTPVWRDRLGGREAPPPPAISPGGPRHMGRGGGPRELADAGRGGPPWHGRRMARARLGLSKSGGAYSARSLWPTPGLARRPGDRSRPCGPPDPLCTDWSAGVPLDDLLQGQTPPFRPPAPCYGPSVH